ncbi:uncharacterized protein LOC124283089 [Haliotis rubra]|uniref:uncharacterized protein LOC124283089 n=1 Tax=Haliotis rubra TaxID=36100 RepID=UPI001EE5F667|nr:uncharacterized protein LOC124283089 [Haliotis rubra]
MSLAFAISILTFLTVTACSAEYMDHRGREFLLGFPLWPNVSQGGSIKLHVRGPKFTNITTEILGSGEIYNYTVGFSETLTINLSTNVEYNGTETPNNNSVRVLSTDEVYVYVIRGVSGGYFAVPKLNWTKEFYIVSYPPSDGGYSYFAIIGYEDANVEITFRKDVNFGSILISPHVPIRVRILPMQIWSIYSSQDLTGTYIKSQKPISVLAGTTFPGAPHGGKFVEEMLLPIAFFGSNYIIPTISGDDAVLRIVASENNTVIYAEGDLYSYMGAGDYVDIVTDDEDVHCLKSTRPIQVVLIGKRANVSSYSVDGFLGDPIMAVVPAVERFQNHDKIDVFTEAGDGLIRQLLFFFQNDSDIEIGGTAESFFEYSDCCNHVISYLVDSQQTVLPMPQGFSVGVMQLATSGSKGYGLTMGVSLDPSFCPTKYGFTYLNTSGLCVKAYTTPTTWTEARALCREDRLRLVTLDTQAKINGIKHFLKDQLNNHTFSIGLHTFSVLFDLSMYNWIDGGSLGNALDWLPQQPDNISSCVQLASRNSKVGWQSTHCDATSGYICEVVLAQKQDVQLFSGECQYSHPGCPTADGYTYIYEAELCVKHHLQPQSWVNAAVACRADGGRLVTVDSDTKQYYLHRVYRHISPNYYIGSSWRNLTTGQWVWTNCSSLTYNNWDLGQPQDKNGHCAVTNPSGSWYNVQCNEVMPYICERSLTTYAGKDIGGQADRTCEEMSSLLPSMLSSSSLVLPPSSWSVLTSEYSPSTSTPPSMHTDHSNVVPTETGGSVQSESDLISSAGLSIDDTQSSVSSADSPLVSTDTAGTSSLTTLTDMSTSTNSVLTPSLNSSSEVSETLVQSSMYDSGHDIMPSTTFSSPQSQETTVSHRSTGSKDSIGLSDSPDSSFSPDSSTLQPTISGTDTNPESSSIIPMTTQADTSSVTGPTNETDNMETQSERNTSSSPGASSNYTERIMYTTTIIPDSNPERGVFEICRCSCIPENRLNDLAVESVDEKTREIKDKLLLDRRNLTKTIIKYISSPDERKSSTSIGASGLVLIVFIVVLLLSSDLLTFFQNRRYQRKTFQE